MNKLHKLNAVFSAVALSLMAAPALAEESKDKEKNVEVIVVSGTPGGVGISKKDASFAITNVDADLIEKISPKSTADLFKAVPGIWVESSGGESGANVFVRGFPASGDAPFLTLSIEGSPIYPAPTLSFLENSSIFRIDETIETMEALRGGPNPVVSNGQPGLTTNFRLKRGGPDTAALAKYTTSDYGLQRADLVLSGELSDDLYYMIGGYIKRSPGIRDAGFTSEDGQQVTINLTREFDKGEVNFYSRITDDTGTWYLPTPLNVEGVDAGYTQLGTLNRQAKLYYGANNESDIFDFGEGRGWKGHVTGGSVKFDLGNGWNIIDRFSLTSGDANTFGLVPEGAATKLANVADNGESATGAVTGTVYGADTDVQQIGRWVVLKDIRAFTNDLALSKSWDNLSTSVGLYTASTSANDWWSLGNQAYHVLESGGEMLSGIECNDAIEGCTWNYDIASTGDARTRALYATASYIINEQLTVDGGIRSENHVVEYSVDEGLDGQITKALSYDESKTSWTLGANYSIDESNAVFARVNNGYKMPYFDDFRDNYGAYTSGQNLIKEVSQLEVGYKYMTDAIQAYTTIFTNEVQGDTFVRRPGVPAEILTNEAIGAEFDVNFTNQEGFNVNLNATVQDTEITASATNEGNESQRQPGWQLRVTPSYAFELENQQYLTVYGTVTSVDDRFGNNENTVVLDGYTKVDLGLLYEPTDQVKLQLAIDNVSDKLGITEGDPRNPAAPNGRYIMPRSIKLSVTYQMF
ncbi:TonB-dependent receptor [Psychrosphaera ytuae]|uniref:TonB-dependent receptor n=1 Tax=Psychrosphaera ytuae TaxID=2820710 RepID=A0A975DCF3_9GAMM|nr:TonB-dependent receptor [Psychrosphaera ytuae]QTH63085.1 TonB-dependent receptor [Psychrosphaera ytuae]